MSGAADGFSVGVLDANGQWPTPPRVWSYSSLREASECPRRWMLSRATYPDIWGRRGYPPKPSQPALMGDIVHGLLEVLLRALRDTGCSSQADPGAVDALKALGGYTKLVEDGIDKQLQRLADNPRVGDKLGVLRTALRTKVPDIRQRVQAMLARSRFEFRDAPTAAATGERRALAAGFYPEIELRAPTLRLVGRVDLLHVAASGCEITDYKTGAPDPRHADQLQLYALMWSRDTELNPQALPVTKLLLAYPDHDVTVEAPNPEGLAQLAASTAASIEAAESALQERPPPAHPEPTICARCGVRQLCSDYWLDPPKVPPADQAATDSAWFDFEGTIIERNGPRSWLVRGGPSQEVLLLRTPTEVVPFRVDDRVRLLNLYRDADPESSLPIGSFSHVSEAFTVTQSR